MSKRIYKLVRRISKDHSISIYCNWASEGATDPNEFNRLAGYVRLHMDNQGQMSIRSSGCQHWQLVKVLEAYTRLRDLSTSWFDIKPNLTPPNLGRQQMMKLLNHECKEHYQNTYTALFGDKE